MKKINVLVNYGGVLTNELRILPGLYDVDAPELFGIADYLVESGHAVAVGTDDVKPVREATKAVEVERAQVDRPTETGADEVEPSAKLPVELKKPKGK